MGKTPSRLFSFPDLLFPKARKPRHPPRSVAIYASLPGCCALDAVAARPLGHSAPPSPSHPRARALLILRREDKQESPPALLGGLSRLATALQNVIKYLTPLVKQELGVVSLQRVLEPEPVPVELTVQEKPCESQARLVFASRATHPLAAHANGIGSEVPAHIRMSFPAGPPSIGDSFFSPTPVNLLLLQALQARQASRGPSDRPRGSVGGLCQDKKRGGQTASS